MKIHVRRYRRQAATGKTVTVRAYEREVGDGTAPVPEWSRPAHVSDLPRQPAADAAGDWWDDDAPDEAGEEAEMSPAFAAMVEQNPSLGGEDFRRLKALRDSGYTGWVDQDGNKVIRDTGITVTPEDPLPTWTEW